MPARAWRHRGRGAMSPWMRAPVPARWPPPWWPVAATAQGHRDRRPCRGRRLPPRARQVHASPQAVNRPPVPRLTTTGLDRPGRISISIPRPTAGRRHPVAPGLMLLQRRLRRPMRPPRTSLSRMNPPRPHRLCRHPRRAHLLCNRPFRYRLPLRHPLRRPPPRRPPPRHMPLQQHMPLRWHRRPRPQTPQPRPTHALRPMLLRCQALPLRLIRPPSPPRWISTVTGRVLWRACTPRAPCASCWPRAS